MSALRRSRGGEKGLIRPRADIKTRLLTRAELEAVAARAPQVRALVWWQVAYARAAAKEQA